MKISAQLLLDNLQTIFDVQAFHIQEKHWLLQPRFLMPETELENHRIYLFRNDEAFPLERINNSMLLICTEDTVVPEIIQKKIPLFVIKNTSISELSNVVSDVFEKFEFWETSLKQALSSKADISELIELTFPLLNNDLTVVDDNLHVIAAVHIQKEEDGTLSVQHFQKKYIMPSDSSMQFLNLYEINKNKRSSFFSYGGSYCTNIYIDDKYSGNVSLMPLVFPMRKSDVEIMDVLTEYIRQAFQLHTKRSEEKALLLKQSLKELLDGNPVTLRQSSGYLPSEPKKDSPRHCCFCIIIQEQSTQLPIHYICNLIAEHFPKCAVFVYNSSIVGLWDFAMLSFGPKTAETILQKEMEKLNLHAGISYFFNDVSKFKYYYMQAEYACEHKMISLEERLHYFQDIALDYLLTHSTGRFSIEYICPPNLLALRQYDAFSSADYWNTLRTYLDLNMNLAETARALYIHRNTLLQRLEKIQKLLDSDMKDPEMRLWLRLSIYLYDKEFLRE